MTHPRCRFSPWLLLLVAGCVWTDAVVETRPLPEARPSDQGPGDGLPRATPPSEPGPPPTATPLTGAPAGAPASESPSTAATSAAPGAAPVPLVATGVAHEPAASPPIAGQDAAPKAEFAMLGGGLMLVTATDVPSFGAGPAMLRLTLPIGLRAGKPGLAELAAEVAVDLKLPSRPGGSLRGGLARLGATIEVRVAAATTSFDVVFPPAAYRDVLGVLATHLSQPLDPAVQTETFEALQVGLAARLGRGWLQAPMLAMVERMRAGRTRALADVISQINLRTAAEVAVFQRAHYVAPGAVLATWLPGVSQAEQALGAVATLPPWLDVRKPPAAMPLLAPQSTQGGVFWAPYDGPVQVALFLPQPGLDQPLAAEMLVLLECLTHDGLGGRLGLALEGLPLVARDVAFDVLGADETDHVALVARAQEDIVVPLWEALLQVQSSFQLRPPVDAELREAAARARFRLLQQVSDPRAWLRSVSRLVYRRATPEVFAATLARLASPTKLDLAAAIPGFCETPLALAVVGGQPPSVSSRPVQLVTDAVLPHERAAQLLPPDELAARREEAGRYLAAAVEAMGGKAALRELHGYQETLASDTGVGPRIETTTLYRDDGRMRQTTRILATTIDTRIDAAGGVESSQGRTEPIAVDEARSRLLAAARHPTLLVARFARGELAFRVVALRLAAGREQAVLEEIGEGPDSLRLTLDTRSGLVRALEVRTWNPEVGALVMREELSDYRTIRGRVRVPFLRTRSFDEGEPTHTLRTLEFDSETPSDEALK